MSWSDSCRGTHSGGNKLSENVRAVLEVIQLHRAGHCELREGGGDSPSPSTSDSDFESRFCNEIALPLEPGEYELLAELLQWNGTAKSVTGKSFMIVLRLLFSLA